MTSELTKLEIQTLFAIAQDMGLTFDEQAQPVYELGAHLVRFDPLGRDRCAFRVQVHFHLHMETTEYGVFVRQTCGRMLLWKEFPKDCGRETELMVCRTALFQSAGRLLRERATQADVDATS